MNNLKGNLGKLDVLLCGLSFTSRTETVEEYFRDKVNSLTVIALSGCFLKENLSSCRVYEKGILKKEFKMHNFRIKDYKWFRQPLVLLVFLVNWLSISLTVMKLRKKYDVYIGVSHSFGLWGAVLKKIKIIRKLVYYCIDYYIPEKKFEFNTLFVKLINIIDRFTVENADYVWDISPKIPEHRAKIGKIKVGSYRNTIVPLGYSKRLNSFTAFDKIERWNIGFVGSVSPNQGLQLLVEAMPLVLSELPQVKVTVIGQGPFLNELKEMVSRQGLERHFDFTGFINDEDKMLNILSRCAVAVALYHSPTESDNITCADTGKPKLYALRGLAIIATKCCSLAQEISRNKAGIVIDYRKEDLKDAVVGLMQSDEKLKEFRMNSFNLGKKFIADSIFDNAIERLNLS